MTEQREERRRRSRSADDQKQPQDESVRAPAAELTESAEKPEGGEKEEREAREAMQHLYSLFGEVLDLMARHEGYAGKVLSRAHMDVLPPLALRQYRIVRDKEGALTNYISWAKTNDATLAEMKPGKNLSNPNDWQSGEIGVVIDVVSGDIQTSSKMIGYLKQEEFKDGHLYAMQLSEGKSELTEVVLGSEPSGKTTLN